MKQNRKHHVSIRYRLHGTYQGNSVSFVLRKEDPSQYLLVNRGFNWINEYPFNR